MLWKYVDPYENLDDRGKCSKTSWPEKEESYSHLIMEEITDQITSMQKEFERFWNKDFRRISWFVCPRR